MPSLSYHKEPAQGTQSPQLGGFSCLSLCLYGIRIGSFHAGKGSIIELTLCQSSLDISLVGSISLCGTIFMTVAISIERFLGICYPLHLPPQNRKAWYYVLPIFCLSVLVNLPKFFEGEIHYEEEEDGFMREIGMMAEGFNISTADSESAVPQVKPTELRLDSNYIKYYVTYCRQSGKQGVLSCVFMT